MITFDNISFEPCHVSPRCECLKCGAILPLASQSWCNTCHRILDMPNSCEHTPDVIEAGYPPSFHQLQKVEAVPHVVAVEKWPEVEGKKRELSADAWSQLYQQGYAAPPRNYQRLIRPKRRNVGYLGKAG